VKAFKRYLITCKPLIGNAVKMVFTITLLSISAAATSSPVNHSGFLVDRGMPYSDQVNFIRKLERQGVLQSSGVSTKKFFTLQGAIAWLKSARKQTLTHPVSVARQLEGTWVWWIDPPDKLRNITFMQLPIRLYLHNISDKLISGFIFELADSDCDFRSQAQKAYYIVSLSNTDALRPNDAGLYDTSLAPSPGMGQTTGGLFCGTIVSAFR